jgi:asparagine synthase (glutamine-hydrolysing)
MCGIAGIVQLADCKDVDLSALQRMRDALRHRGPDDDGIWTSPNRRTGFAHTRLSIVDLTPTGAQPMSTPDGLFTIVFNGEIYNHEELRQRLANTGAAFRGRSDTEVLLRLYVELGSRCLDELDGMFAFAVWNEKERTLFCARDHLGEKPLYFAHTRECFAFASEVRALVKAGVVHGSPDLRGIGYLLSQGSIPPPYTHVEGINFLEPGSRLELRVETGVLEKRRYWFIPMAPEMEAIQDARLGTEIVHEALRQSVRSRLRADVPVGAFLSGGIDSSLVVALMREQGANDLRTFTVSLPGQKGDETHAARTTARLLGTDHHEIRLHFGTETEWLDQAIGDMDVPSVDGPNTWLVSRAVRATGAKVACSGLGGDELFYGYLTFTLIPRLARLHLEELLPHIPSTVRLRLARLLPPVPRWSRLAEALLAGGSIAALWYAKRSLMSDREVGELLIESARSMHMHEHTRRIENLACPEGLALQRQVSFYELSVYMHDQLLRDTDQMSMAHALEVRVPLIGKRVVETVAGLGHGALGGDQSKALLRRILAEYLPEDSFRGAKQGFALNWDALLVAPRDSGRAPKSGLFREARVDRLWKQFRSHRTSFAPPFAVGAIESCVRDLAPTSSVLSCHS